MKLEPGIYRATARGVPDQVVLVSKDGFAYNAPDPINRRDMVLTWDSRCNEKLTDARPLIVLDPGDPLVAAFVTEYARRPNDPIGGLLNKLATLIKAQSQPPRIPEPPYGKSVKAVGVDLHGVRRWLRYTETEPVAWIDTLGYRRSWDDLIDPILIRDGIEATS